MGEPEEVGGDEPARGARGVSTGRLQRFVEDHGCRSEVVVERYGGGPSVAKLLGEPVDVLSTRGTPSLQVSKLRVEVARRVRRNILGACGAQTLEQVLAL